MLRVTYILSRNLLEWNFP